MSEDHRVCDQTSAEWAYRLGQEARETKGGGMKRVVGNPFVFGSDHYAFFRAGWMGTPFAETKIRVSS